MSLQSAICWVVETLGSSPVARTGKLSHGDRLVEKERFVSVNQTVRSHLLRHHVGVRSGFLDSCGGFGPSTASPSGWHPCTVDVLPGVDSCANRQVDEQRTRRPQKNDGKSALARLKKGKLA